MPDIFTKQKRSEVMSRIRSTGNKATELRLIQIFRANGIMGWRRGALLQWKAGSGKLKAFRVKPDFVFPRSTGSGLRRAKPVAVFVDGCFWHGCPKHGTKPKTNAAFWRKKIARNRERDRRANYALRKRGWAVVRVWEHELGRKNAARLLSSLRRRLGGGGVTRLFHTPLCALHTRRSTPPLFIEGIKTPADGEIPRCARNDGGPEL